MNKKLSDTTEKIDNEMMIKLLCIAACGGLICESDVEGDFFSGKWVQKAIEKGFLQKTGVTDMGTQCETYQYEVTRIFWEKVRGKINPVKNNQLDYFFQIKTAKAKEI